MSGITQLTFINSIELKLNQKLMKEVQAESEILHKSNSVYAKEIEAPRARVQRRELGRDWYI